MHDVLKQSNLAASNLQITGFFFSVALFSGLHAVQVVHALMGGVFLRTHNRLHRTRVWRTVFTPDVCDS